jgi:hypothetical protein
MLNVSPPEEVDRSPLMRMLLARRPLPVDPAVDPPKSDDEAVSDVRLVFMVAWPWLLPWLFVVLLWVPCGEPLCCSAPRDVIGTSSSSVVLRRADSCGMAWLERRAVLLPSASSSVPDVRLEIS